MAMVSRTKSLWRRPKCLIRRFTTFQIMEIECEWMRIHFGINGNGTHCPQNHYLPKPGINLREFIPFFTKTKQKFSPKSPWWQVEEGTRPMKTHETQPLSARWSELLSSPVARATEQWIRVEDTVFTSSSDFFFPWLNTMKGNGTGRVSKSRIAGSDRTEPVPGQNFNFCPSPGSIPGQNFQTPF